MRISSLSKFTSVRLSRNITFPAGEMRIVFKLELTMFTNKLSVMVDRNSLMNSCTSDSDIKSRHTQSDVVTGTLVSVQVMW